MPRHARRHARSQRSRSHHSPSASHIEDRLLDIPWADAPPNVSSWLCVNPADIAMITTMCTVCGGRIEHTLHRGRRDLVDGDALARSANGLAEEVFPRFFALHDPCDRTAALSAATRHWAARQIEENRERAEAGSRIVIALIATPGGIEVVERRPELVPGIARGESHRRWHAELHSAAAALGGELRTVLHVGPTYITEIGANGRPIAHRATTATMAILATAQRAHAAFVPPVIVRPASALRWEAVIAASALIDGLFAHMVQPTQAADA